MSISNKLTLDSYNPHEQKIFAVLSNFFKSVKSSWDQKVREPLL